MYGEVSVELLSESESPEWIIRKFRLGYVSFFDFQMATDKSFQLVHLSNVNCYCHLQADESQDVLHLNYTSWPDHGVPTVNAIESILQFVHIVRQQANRTKDPIIVHCR